MGGGNFLTQSRPTNFHQFFTRKILTPTEDISDYREVTAAERTALEQADAQWKEPSAELIVQFNQAMTKYIGTESSTETFGHYKPETGYFMYGTVALTTAEVRRMLDFRKTAPTSLQGAYSAMWQLSAVAPILQATNGGIVTAYCFYMCRNMKVVAFNGYTTAENLEWLTHKTCLTDAIRWRRSWESLTCRRATALRGCFSSAAGYARCV